MVCRQGFVILEENLTLSGEQEDTELEGLLRMLGTGPGQLKHSQVFSCSASYLMCVGIRAYPLYESIAEETSFKRQTRVIPPCPLSCIMSHLLYAYLHVTSCYMVLFE